MRKSIWLLTVFLLIGCQSETPPATKPAVVESSPYSSWPSITDKPISVSLYQWADCRGPSPEEVAAHGPPYSNYSILVRVSPESIDSFRKGKPLHTGAVVVKEKHHGGPELQGYAVMTEREAGYYPEGGDWEYQFVDLVPEKKETRGRLANCAGCHASAKGTDFLFRSYGESAK